MGCGSSSQRGANLSNTVVYQKTSPLVTLENADDVRYVDGLSPIPSATTPPVGSEEKWLHDRMDSRTPSFGSFCGEPCEMRRNFVMLARSTWCKVFQSSDEVCASDGEDEKCKEKRNTSVAEWVSQAHG